MNSIQTIGVIGAGAWGTALAQTVRLAGLDVILWARRPEVVAEINGQHRNEGLLPGVPLDPMLRATSDIGVAAACDAVLLVVPAQHTRAIGGALAKHLRFGTPVVICAKGLEQATAKPLSVVLGEVLPTVPLAVLSGPGFADDVGHGRPAALTLACADEGLGERLAAAIGTRNFRLYWSSDVAGTELGGAAKNVFAIAAGIVLGRGLGASAHAALVTRSFAELRRLGSASGARPETLAGLSGLGDLMLTCYSSQSRNMSLGLALGQGRKLAEILGARRSVTEGVTTVAAVTRAAAGMGVEMPIASAVGAIVEGRIGVDQAIEELLSRPFRAEG